MPTACGTIPSKPLFHPRCLQATRCPRSHHRRRALILHTWSTVESLRTDLVEYRPLVLHISSHASEYEIILAEVSGRGSQIACTY
jgi:hypothetical protein